jgi:hypothetical protein
MLLALAAAGSMGLLLGFWLRVPALIAASGMTAVVCLAVAPFTELGPASAVGMTFALVGVLQVGYLGGLIRPCLVEDKTIALRHTFLASGGRAFTQGRGRARQIQFASLGHGLRQDCP